MECGSKTVETRPNYPRLNLLIVTLVAIAIHPGVRVSKIPHAGVYVYRDYEYG